ncbi:hypothetical protein BpHYR1_021558 [Brachionus plicatilis]|uniref:Uncharacterized protein n=1 Tax=Brachionus plicatilis TaxID=10195 RepID=A0A3M7RTN0_BRAPC|nr:hypothetical protein BpHYR1_021558 [Brachionus plicatilis]
MDINIVLNKMSDKQINKTKLSNIQIIRIPSPGFKILNTEKEIYAKIATKF